MLARWDGAFDGLHTLMGYGAITFDNTEEGKRIVKYAKQGTGTGRAPGHATDPAL